jgi:RNA polymerase sigma-B factor
MPGSRQPRHPPERLDDLDVAAVAYARKWRRASDGERHRLRDDLVCRCVPFAHRMARRYRGRPEPMEDLEQVARLALVKAVDRYDPGRGSFTAFAVLTICGEIKRHFRDRTWGVHVNRPLQNLTLEVAVAAAELTHILARHPTVAEIARHLNVGEEQVRYAQACAANHLPVPISMPIDDRGRRELGDLLGGRDEAIEILPDRLAITELLHALPARIQRIIALRFYGDLTQAQIAEEIGISQMHVSRLLRHALTWLRAAMLSDGTPAWTGTEHGQSVHRLRVLVSKNNAEVNVEVRGEIDRDNKAYLWRRLRRAIALASPGRMVIDLAGAPLVDVAGAAMLREVYTSAGFAHVAVRLQGLQPLVASVLAIVGLQDLSPVGPAADARTAPDRPATPPPRVSRAHPSRVHRPGDTVAPSGGATAVAGSEDTDMAVTPTASPDEDIRREVLTELRFDAEVGQSELGVGADNRMVTLTGWVDSLPRKWAAERAALRVRGVKAVANEIDVRLPAGDERTDADIAAFAVRALAWNTRIPKNAVQVSVSNGWVTLRGAVDLHYQRREAHQVIRNLTGIKGITNLTTVRSSDPPAPDYVKDRIVSAHLRSAVLDARQITVALAGGKVTLTGTVLSWVGAAEAERVAWSAPGVTEVDNRIVVQR